jgi:glycosyltransferase 2 family protein
VIEKKAVMVNGAKISVVVLLLWWMASSGKLSWSQMASIYARTDVIVASILVWIIAPVLLGTWRWWMLMKGAGIECSYLRAIKLQLVGFFFNTAMPGAVGGDIIKAIYIVRDQTGSAGKTPAMLSVFLDRVVGLIGLFLMGMVAASFTFDRFLTNPFMTQLFYGLVLVVFLSVVFLSVVFIPYKHGNDPVAKLLHMKIPGFRLIAGIYSSLRLYRDRPFILISTILVSVVIQLVYMFFMGFLGRIMYGSGAFDSALLAPIFPFGVLVTAIPLAPGGLGVGHAAFERLFFMVGLPGGANVFNVYAVNQLLLNLLGLFPYLALKSNSVSHSAHKVPVL